MWRTNTLWFEVGEASPLIPKGWMNWNCFTVFILIQHFPLTGNAGENYPRRPGFHWLILAYFWRGPAMPGSCVFVLPESTHLCTKAPSVEVWLKALLQQFECVCRLLRCCHLTTHVCLFFPPNWNSWQQLEKQLRSKGCDYLLNQCLRSASQHR